MLASLSEFKFYQSFRISVEQSDNLRCLVEREDEAGRTIYIEDARLIDISVTGLGLATKERISVGVVLSLSLQYKKMHLDLTGKVVRAFSNSVGDDEIIYGVELGEEKTVRKFLEQYISSFSSDRLKDSLIECALKEKYTKASEGFEMFSLLLSLFKDITHFGDKEGFLQNMLEEVVRILNAQRSSIFLINPDSNELEAICALGVAKEELRFDYRLGIAGSVFTTGVALNIDTGTDSSRFNEDFDRRFGFETKSIICHPIHNREDKIIGVIEVINKRNQDRFTVEDEKTMKVLALVFSSVFHNYNPISVNSQIRRFSMPHDREYAIIGKTAHVNSLRGTILKVKDLDVPVLIHGEKGSGKTLFARILHIEGRRGLSSFEYIDCAEKDYTKIEEQLFSTDPMKCKLLKCQGGSILLREVCGLPIEMQRRLVNILKDRHIPGSKISLDVRVIATSSEDLSGMVEKSEFVTELYEHISRAFVQIEPLRRRIDDVASLVDYFLKKECKQQGLLLKNFSDKSMQRLMTYDWPGNIQELKLCVERAVLYNPKNHVISDIELENSATPLLDVSYRKRIFGETPFVDDYRIHLKDRLALVEREMILAEVKRNSGNKSKAAKEMGISREALRKKLLVSQQVVTDLNKAGVKVKVSDLGIDGILDDTAEATEVTPTQTAETPATQAEITPEEKGAQVLPFKKVA
ncbi:MAG: hypothetical protein A2X86_11505 [Bdellovibrionales bacterium GWA2_49_15]|nr:MAG: hypothetical protein A2X86_11505 [Bdellovibrionales bacterium GWA2_49_15]HAZ12623.1 hypothetical protein [Bdellovibrionales bacterium]